MLRDFVYTRVGSWLLLKWLRLRGVPELTCSDEQGATPNDPLAVLLRALNQIQEDCRDEIPETVILNRGNILQYCDYRPGELEHQNTVRALDLKRLSSDEMFELIRTWLSAAGGLQDGETYHHRGSLSEKLEPRWRFVVRRARLIGHDGPSPVNN